MRNYYAELRQAEKVGKASVRDLFYVFLDEIKTEKDVLELDRLLNDIECLTVIAGSKELSKMYEKLSSELLSWLGENASAFKGE